jgi:hypothetical protein
VRTQLVVREEAKPWCYVCGRVVDKVIVVRLPCPWCARAHCEPFRAFPAQPSARSSLPSLLHSL